MKTKMPFCPGTERWDRTPGTKMPFCPRPRRFVPGQKGGTEQLGQNVPVPDGLGEGYIYVATTTNKTTFFLVPTLVHFICHIHRM